MESSSKFDPDYNLAFDNPTLCSIAGSSLCARKTPKLRPPLRSNSVTGNQPESRTHNFPLLGVVSTRNIDYEIESIKKEISRLSTRLEFLRLEKMKRIAAKSAAALKRGRFVPAKFMDPPLPPAINPRKIEESMKTPSRRKGITPVHRSQSRRKSCFWKLEEVDELGVIDKRGKTVSSSLKSQKAVRNFQADSCKQVVTILRASKNTSVEKEDGVSPSIQPKELFEDGDKSGAAKNKSLRCGSRAVASRYKNSNGGNGNGDSVAIKGARKKRSLPGNDNTFSRKRISLSI